MSDTENEENNGNSSNTKMVDIKKKNIQEQEQQEQDVNLQIGTSISQQQIKIVPTNEELDRSPKQPRITGSNEAESSKQNEQESDYDSGSDSTFNEIEQDPLLVTEEVLLKYYEFIEYVYQILKNDEEKQDWSFEIIDRVNTLVMTLGRKLRVVMLDMARLEVVDVAEKEYEFKKTHILNILALIRHINVGIASSSSFRLVSDIKNRRKVLPVCLWELERWSQKLRRWIRAMQILKKMALEL
ncbi:hypothetical protein E5676_scaffold615G00360 [Cucumis melo var. makuwa]|uniref:Uncharacterized protein n=1 Tax=Cucumis melo var. makuwa TaxID=1194695 RepID=A0A5A7VJB2_CUCMM|nr:hypothetical protein E6C27_scaffold179G00130 [Cucumis melo var. makuwa]TYK09006.1 hypothetical protein E5676_scaffold615G00360 [Cucumis melo var. makuwa]